MEPKPQKSGHWRGGAIGKESGLRETQEHTKELRIGKEISILLALKIRRAEFCECGT